MHKQITDRARGSMLACAIDAYGGPERMQLMELPIPNAELNDLLIRMHGAEVGNWDAMVREGQWPMERPFPLVLGLAGAGTVEAVGKNVNAFRRDDPVYVYSYPLYDNGAWAEYMLVPVNYVARAPATLDLVQAGAVPIVGLTAHETLIDILGVRQGEVVLVTAAAGGVGHLAVQIAARRGARVVATAGRRNHEFVRALGAEMVIDYAMEDLVAAIHARFPQGIDKALNGVEGETANQVARAVRPGGRMVDLTGSVSMKRPEVSVDTEYVVRGDGKRLAAIARMIDEGHLNVVVQESFPLPHAAKALDVVLAGHVRGKIALKIAEDDKPRSPSLNARNKERTVLPNA